MPNEDLIREIATKAFCEALREKSQELAESVARKMGAVLGTQSPQRARTKELRDGSVLIAGSRTQTEALETLLAASSAITPGCGLLILRGGQGNGWSCHGLTALDNFKRAVLDCSRGIAATVINSGAATATEARELDPAFTARLGLEKSSQVLLVPVLLKERVAALLIAVPQAPLPDAGEELAALELLVQVAQLTLDLQAYRKVSAQHPAAAPRPAEPRSAEPNKVSETATPPRQGAEAPPVYAAANGVATPAAAAVVHAAVHTVIQKPEPEPAYAGTAAARTLALPSPIAQVADLREPVAAPPAVTAPPMDEAHEKARRFAKLLVEEIKLYNQTKVAEGRARCDLYSRLHDDIEKSRMAYHRRYGESVRDVDYFTQELMRILADNNRAVMGAGFPG
jgi:hypothetical protein